MFKKKKQKQVDDGLQKKKKASKWREKLDMYDMLMANLISGTSIIRPEYHLDGSQIAIGFSNISSKKQLTKYFLIQRLPDYVNRQLYNELRTVSIRPGVRINIVVYGAPHTIAWDSPEMRSKRRYWDKFNKEQEQIEKNVYDIQSQRVQTQANARLVNSYSYLEKSDTVDKRSFFNSSLLVEFTAPNDNNSLYMMSESIDLFKAYCNKNDIKYRELKVNLIDWIQGLGIFSLKRSREIEQKMSRRVLTDDILANMKSFEQGRIGYRGICLGMDVNSGLAVLRKLKDDPSKPENWVISGTTGSGKSFFTKNMTLQLLADGFFITIMDYEGDEYTAIVDYIKGYNPKDAQVISLGKGSKLYCDPCPLPKETGEPDIDNERKENAVEFIMALFRVMRHGLSGDLTNEEKKVLTVAISDMYDSVAITNANKHLWYERTKKLRLKNVYLNIKRMVETKRLKSNQNEGDRLHTAAMELLESTSVYFQEGSTKADTFANPIQLDDLYGSRYVVFSFGMKGASAQLSDNTILALKQLSVAYMSIQISNFCKYVKKCFNVKVWEEYQRWGEIQGSADIIGNAMTGGRKRGDVNLLITNDLGALLDEENKINQKLRQNVHNFAIGKVRDTAVIEKFCDSYAMPDIERDLKNIAVATQAEGERGDDAVGGVKVPRKSKSAMQGKYSHGFCLVLDDGKRAVVRVEIPKVLAKSPLFDSTQLDKVQEG